MVSPQKQINWRVKRRDFIRALKNKPCTDCKNSYPWYVMEFDHVRGKKLFRISEASGRGIGMEKLLQEVDKCELVCANCHQSRTFLRK